MDITDLKEPVTVVNSDLDGNIAGLRVDGHLVSDLIAAWKKSV